jgi:hypothetical protein
MVESHHVMVTAILMAVVVVGISGLYFTMGTGEGPSIVYLSSGPTYSGASQGLYKPLSQSFAQPRAFSVLGQGLTGLSVQRFGTASINTTAQPDLRMPKNSILCTAEIFQDNDTATFYTCGDQNASGGSIECDVGAFGGPGSSVTNQTNATNCVGTNADPTGASILANGAFVVCNHGATGALNALAINISIAGANSSNITLDNYIFNATDNDANKGCVGACNNCPAADTTGCFKDPKGVLYSNNITECDFFDTSGQCLCECTSIHVTDDDDVHLLKNGDTLEFIVKKTIVSTSLNASSECT